MFSSLPEKARSSRFISCRKLSHVAADVRWGDWSVDPDPELLSLSTFKTLSDLSSGVLAVDRKVSSCQLHVFLVSLDHRPIAIVLRWRRPAPVDKMAWKMVSAANNAATKPIGTVKAKFRGSS